MKKVFVILTLSALAFCLPMHAIASPISSYSEIAASVDMTVDFEDLYGVVGQQFGFGAGDPYLSLGLDMDFQTIEVVDIGSVSGGIAVRSSEIVEIGPIGSSHYENRTQFAFTEVQDAVGFYYQDLNALEIKFMAYDVSDNLLELYSTTVNQGYAGFSRGSEEIVTIRIYATHEDYPYSRVYLDDISFSAAASVPEPVTMLLLGFGIIGIAGFRRKFKE